MVYQGATGLYHFLINVISFISNSVYIYINISIIIIIIIIRFRQCQGNYISSVAYLYNYPFINISFIIMINDK